MYQGRVPLGMQEQDGFEQVHTPDLEVGHHHPGRILLVVLDGQQEQFKLAELRQHCHRCTLPISCALNPPAAQSIAGC